MAQEINAKVVKKEIKNKKNMLFCWKMSIDAFF